MWWMCIVAAQFLVIAAGIRDEQRVGLWSWSKFSFAPGFAALECIIVIGPAYYIHDVHNRCFLAVYIASWIIAALNFIWMILVVRRWKAPDRRTILSSK
jgi:hypothetical protein